MSWPFRFEEPAWLWLGLVLVFVGWRFRSLQLWRPLRVAILAALLLGLARFQVPMGSTALDLWVLMDRSDSTRKEVAEQSAEWIGLLERARPSDARLRRMDFADEAQEIAGGDAAIYSGATFSTRTRLALRSVLSGKDKDRLARVLVFTDGYSTESLDDVAASLKEAGVPVDFRLTGPDFSSDTRIQSINAPPQVRGEEPFLIQFEIVGAAQGSVPYTVLGDGDHLVASGTAALNRGRAVVRLVEPAMRKGASRYEVRIQPVQDPFAGNNKASIWVERAAGRRVMLVSQYADDPLRDVLRRAGFEVELRTDGLKLMAGALSGVGVVVLNNVASSRVSAEFLAALPFFVNEQGGGLWMCGGKNSFGSGGYFESAIDELLPVSMELRQEHRKLAVAVAIVMDRSGSMTARTADGRMKMDLANDGAARAIELLGALDQVTVFAVDSAAHEVVPLTTLGSNRGAILSNVRRIASEGGGIFVHEGLSAGWRELQKAELETRHIILFSDAADSEEPGDYVRLLKEITDKGGSVSVIGLGSKADTDAALLEDIARLGNGRIFFCDDATTLPALFAQETVAVARSTFVESATGLSPTGGWVEIAARSLTWPDAVDGYNLSYLREGARVAAVSGDEYAAPLVAWWQRGTGRVATVSFPMAGAFSARVRAWPQIGDFRKRSAAGSAELAFRQGYTCGPSAMGRAWFLSCFMMNHGCQSSQKARRVWS